MASFFNENYELDLNCINHSLPIDFDGTTDMASQASLKVFGNNVMW